MEVRTISEQAVLDYEAYLVQKEKSEDTVKKYVRDVGAFRLFLGPDAVVTRELVLAYKVQIREQYKVRSMNSMLSALNYFFVYMGWCDLKVSQCRVQRQMFQSASRELTKDEYKRLLAAAQEKKNERLCLLVEAICATGIRVSEHKYITVESLQTGIAEISCKGKRVYPEFCVNGQMQRK